MIYGTAHCDGCGRTERLHGPQHLPEGWGVLTVKTRRLDLCLGCIAKVHGWANPYISGEGSTRVGDVIRAGAA